MILAVGDLHGDFKRLRSLIQRTSAEIVLQVGDFGYYPGSNSYNIECLQDLSCKIYWCDGNHEDFGSINELSNLYDEKPIQIKKNIWYCPRGSTLQLPDGRVVLFAGGALSIGRKHKRPNYDWFLCETLDENIIPLIKKIPYVDIIVTHTAPTYIPVKIPSPKIFIDSSRKILDKVCDYVQPKTWVFGHWHQYIETEHKGCKFIGLDRIDTNDNFEGSYIEI